MSQNLAAFTPIKFALKTIDLLYNETIYRNVTNTKYEGTLKESGDKVRVRTSHKISLSAYTKGMTLVAQDLNPTYEDLEIDQKNYFKFVVDDIDKVQNDIDAINEYAQNAKRDISEMLDTDILSYMRKNVKSANMIGTAYATGTVTITATTGAVVGAGGATFTAAMVGGIFTCSALAGAGATTSYRVKTYTDAANIVIEDLKGGVYTGGAAAGGSAYSIAGATHVALTKDTVYQHIVALRTALGKSLAPMAERFLIVNSEFEGLLLQAPQFIPAVGSAYEDAVKGGKVGSIAGFNVYRSELIDGNNTTGYWFIAGNKDFCSMAVQLDKMSVVPSEADPTTFTSTCKGLVVWGRKVFEGTRAFGAVLRATC
jgi:hypothetical protein